AQGRRLSDGLRFVEQHVVERRFVSRLGDEFVRNRERGFFVRRQLELEPVAHGELQNAIGGGHAHALVHVKRLDHGRKAEQQRLVGGDYFSYHLAGEAGRLDGCLFQDGRLSKQATKVLR